MSEDELDMTQEFSQEALHMTPQPIEEVFAAQKKAYAYEGFKEDPKSLWLISFTDLIGVMLAFFVLMYSMSSPREDRWVEVSQAIEQGVTQKGLYKGSQWNAGSDETVALQGMNLSRGLDTSYLVGILGDFIKTDKRLEKVRVRRENNQVSLVLPADLMSAEQPRQLSEEGEIITAAMADLLTRIDNRIEIVTVVDAAAARKNQVNGWQVALERAVIIGAALQAEGYEKSVSAHAVFDADSDSAGEMAIIVTPDDGTAQTQPLKFEDDERP